MDNGMFFVLKFENILKRKSMNLLFFPCSTLFGKTHETRNSRGCSITLTYHRILELKRRYLRMILVLKNT